MFTRSKRGGPRIGACRPEQKAKPLAVDRSSERVLYASCPVRSIMKAMSNDQRDNAPKDPRDKVREFPTAPGVYLMKDAQGRVIYVGKAVNLRSRASSYFNRTAAGDRRRADLVTEIADVD